MYLEVEYDAEPQSSSPRPTGYSYIHFENTQPKMLDAFMCPAVIDSIAANGFLNVRYLDGSNTIALIEPYSTSIHPCGFWKFIKTSDKYQSDYSGILDFKVSPELEKNLTSFHKGKITIKIFNWNLFFSTHDELVGAPFLLFDKKQTDGMDISFYPEHTPGENFLSCDYNLNPRFIWTTIKQLNQDAITEIYHELGIISPNRDMFNEETKLESDSSLPNERKIPPAALVILPESIENNFMKYPNLNSVNSMTALNVSCTHREEIRILIGSGQIVSNNYPHLIQTDSFNLIKNNVKLTLNQLLVIMCACFDLGTSTVSFMFKLL